MSKTVRVYFEGLLASGNSISSFSVNVFAPKESTDDEYTLLGTGGGPVTITERHKEGSDWCLTGYAVLQSMRDSFNVPYVLLAPDFSYSHPKKYLGVPYAYMPQKTVNGTQAYDIQPAFTDWELNTTEES